MCPKKVNNLKPTKVAKINSGQPGLKLIKQAARIIKKGGLIVLPTDTVYGLVCDATNPQAVAKLFQVKRRPKTQPLSIAVSRFSDIKKYASAIPQSAKILAQKFLPGPLTLVLKKSSLIPNIVTAGRNDIGIRIPDSKIVLQLIRSTKRPIVIPSANLHNKPSPVTAQQAQKDLAGKVDLIIDGGRTKYGVESTIVSFTQEKIKILREGAIPIIKLKRALKPIIRKLV